VLLEPEPPLEPDPPLEPEPLEPDPPPEPVLPPPELPELEAVPPLEPDVVPPELPLDAEPLELEPLPEPKPPPLPPFEPHEQTRPTATAAATQDAGVIARVGERVIPGLLRLRQAAAHDAEASPFVAHPCTGCAYGPPTERA
jgi:hypothetical protein